MKTIHSAISWTQAMSLEYPSGPVPLDSPFYIHRPPIEELAYQEICKPGSVVRIKAPRKMGKSSLLNRILAHSKTLHYRTVCLDFQQADEVIFANFDKFLRWFCINVSRQLQIPANLDEYWDEEMGSKVSCTLYFEAYLLEQITSPLVLALNEVNRIFEYPKISQEFFPLLRSWHEESRQIESLQKLRLIVAHSTEIYIPLNVCQSPFNIGLPLTLPSFNPEQVQELADRHGLDWFNEEMAEQVTDMVGGHPYLVRLALYHLVQSTQGVESVEQKTEVFNEILRNAPTQGGIYGHYLREHLAILQNQPQLLKTVKKIALTQGSLQVETILAYKLESLGLVKIQGNYTHISCKLFRLFFEYSPPGEAQFHQERLEVLERTNQELLQLVNVDELTQVANRRYFNYYLQTQWQKLARDVVPLSLIMCDIDCFKAYNDTLGHLAGDQCLKQVAQTLRNCLKRPSDVVARYGGEEFAIILPYTELSSAIHLAELARTAIKALNISHLASTLNVGVVTASFGVACMVPDPLVDSQVLVCFADEALYQSKGNGRDQVSWKER